MKVREALIVKQPQEVLTEAPHVFVLSADISGTFPPPGPDVDSLPPGGAVADCEEPE